MREYLNLAVLLNFLVDLMLLLGTNRLAGYPCSVIRCLVAAAVGGVYSGACLLPGFRFLGNTLWHTVCLGIMGAVAFGLSGSAFRRSILFFLLRMALGGLAAGLGNGNIFFQAAGAAGLAALCALGFRDGVGQRQFVEVELRRGEKRVKLLALRDTGNTLTDPVTGQSVLVADAESALTLLGLSRQQLLQPVETVASGAVSGLRLIPYRAVGQPGGMLLAVRLDSVRIGNRHGGALVAFAPEGLGEEGTYRALVGGMV